MDPDLFDKALEKLWIHGGAVLDYAENVSLGQGPWRESYIAHGEHKRAQIDLVIRYAETNQCRMSTLVRHFGDLADGQTACGICDFCAPAECVAQRFRTATEAEREALFEVLAALHSGARTSTGKLHTELFPGGEISRDAFEDVLGAMARAGLVRLADAVFEKDGRQIPYRTVSLTPAGRAADESTPIEFIMKDIAAAPATRKRRKKAAAKQVAKPKRKRAPAGADTGVEEALRAWRVTEARRLGVPPFRIFNDQALRAIAETRPASAAELLAIPGIGIRTVEKYGRHIYRILEEAG
jgi:superfamily II DNA helicase RecQ